MPLGSTVPSQFLSEVFRLFDGSDVTKKVKFILSGITSGNVRALTIPDSNGVIVLEGSAPEFTGLTLTGLTPTSVLFAGTGGLVAEDEEFVYDSEDNYLKIQQVSVGGDGRISAYDTVNDDHDFIINAKGAGGVFINKDGGGSNGIYFYNGADYKLGWFGGATFGEFRAYSEGNTEWLQFASTARYGFLEVKGAAPRATILNNSAYADVWMFQASGEGKTRALRIYGRRIGDSKRYLSIVTGGSAADTVDFTGLGSYKFNGIVEATELKVINAINEFSVDGTLDGNSDSAVPTEKAVRTYVDNQVAGVNEFVELTDTPNSYGSADIGKVLRLKNDLSGLEFTDTPVFAGLTVGSLAGILKGTNGVVSAITDNSGNWNTAYGWGDHAGLYDSAGTMTTHEGNFTHSDIALNTTHRGLSSGNPHSVTPTELSLVIGTNVQAADAGLLSLAGLSYAAAAFVKMTGADTFVLRTIGETADDLEATIDHDILANGGAHDYSYISGNDGNTNVTGEELEELTDGGQTTLHSHAGAGATFLDLTDTPNSYDSGDIGKYLRLKDDLSGLEFATPAGAGATTWIALTDTDPANYTGQAGNTVVVNAGEDGLEFGAAPGGTFTSKCSVYRSGTQAMTSGAYTKIQFNTEDYDTNGEFDSSSNYRFQPDANGYYAISSALEVSELNDTNSVVIAVYKNGAIWKAGKLTLGVGTGVFATISCDMYLITTDYVEIWCYHNYGSNRNVGTAGRFTFLDVHRFA